MQWLGIGFVYFWYVFLRAFQQRNVTLNHPQWVMPLSYMMAAVDVFMVTTIATTGWKTGLVISIGTGGGLGCLLAMWLHKELLKEKCDE